MIVYLCRIICCLCGFIDGLFGFILVDFLFKFFVNGFGNYYDGNFFFRSSIISKYWNFRRIYWKNL